MTVEIKHRWTNAVLFTSQVESVREALEGAVRARANLVGASLARASLARANLDGANLDGANLVGANLDGANLARAKGVGDWTKTIRDDIRTVLDAAPNEVPGLLAALWAGKVDGSTYEGECACLVGTVAKVRGVHYRSLGPLLHPDSTRPAERWFLGIRKGDTPVTNPSAAFAAAVIAQWQHERVTTPTKKARVKAAS